MQRVMTRFSCRFSSQESRIVGVRRQREREEEEGKKEKKRVERK